MKSPSAYSRVRRTASLISVLVLLILSAATTRANPAPQNSSFSVPQWTSLRIRMDDTLTSKYSMEGDPFSATVMDDGMYQALASTVRFKRSIIPADFAGTPRWFSSSIAS